jgi:hypothetical protein
VSLHYELNKFIMQCLFLELDDCRGLLAQLVRAHP